MLVLIKEEKYCFLLTLISFFSTSIYFDVYLEFECWILSVVMLDSYKIASTITLNE